MAERVRKRIEQPSEETGKRNTVLVWGAVLGVLAGLMLGVYALPPILRHYYGETKVAADEYYSGEGKLMKVVNIGQASEPLGEAAAGMRREDYFVSISVVSKETWAPAPALFSVEFAGVHDWVQAKEATVDGEPLRSIAPGVETEVSLHFVVELPRETFPELKPKALHLSDPRVRFAIAE